MTRTTNGTKPNPLQEAIRDASRHVSNAMSLVVFAAKEEVDAAWHQAAVKEELAAYLLEAEGKELEAAVHRISAASCYEDIGDYARAITLLRAALSVKLRPVYRIKIENQLKDCLKKVRKKPRRSSHKKTASAP